MDAVIFHLINQFAGRWTVVDAAFVFGATWLVWFFLLFVLGHLVTGYGSASLQRRKELLFCALFTVVVSFVTAQIVSHFYFRERPFVLENGVHKLVDRSPLDKSFPSDHSIVAFSFAFAVALYNKKYGAYAFAIASFIGLSRVFVGVHYLSDVVVGAAFPGVVAYVFYHANLSQLLLHESFSGRARRLKRRVIDFLQRI